MNDPLFNIALLIIVVCNLGVLRLWFKQTDMLRERPTTKTMFDSLAGFQGSLKVTIEKDGQLTRQRIAQVKTRLADEEKDDQRAKRRARRQRR